MDEKAQVSIEYLLTILFGIILVMAAAILLDNLRVVAQSARAEILTQREKTIASLIE
ncbi:MAG: hypothetical protein ABIE23_01485 [archaeon]|nr:hypothetical protein [Candidatus Micrarchaeota archaeon]